MPNIKTITSSSNPFYKNVIALLDKPKERKHQGLFVVEGIRENTLCIAAGYRLQSLIVACGSKTATTLLSNQTTQADLIEMDSKLLNRLVYRQQEQAILGIYYIKNIKLEDLKCSSNPLLIVLENVEKPGNLGAIARSADAAGIDGIIVCDNQTDIFNPNVIRSSLGCVFTIPVVQATNEEALNFCRYNNIQTAGAIVDAETAYYKLNMSKATAIVMGSEAQGLSNFWKQNVEHSISIPMYGKVDSMNVSVSTAVILFEALRQRNA